MNMNLHSHIFRGTVIAIHNRKKPPTTGQVALWTRQPQKNSMGEIQAESLGPTRPRGEGSGPHSAKGWVFVEFSIRLYFYCMRDFDNLSLQGIA